MRHPPTSIATTRCVALLTAKLLESVQLSAFLVSLRLTSSSLALVRFLMPDDLVLGVPVQFLLSRVDLVLHQVINPQAQSYVVQKHV